MRVSGEVRIGEGAAFATRATAPITNAPWPFLIIVAASALGGFLAVALGVFLGRKGIIPQAFVPLAILIAWVLSFRISIRLSRAFNVRNFRRTLLARGIPDPVATVFEVTADCFICRSEGVEYRAEWRAITDLLRVGPYWVAIAQALPLMVPRRFFADQTAEQLFIGAMVERLGPAARARSGHALRFLEAA